MRWLCSVVVVVSIGMFWGCDVDPSPIDAGGGGAGGGGGSVVDAGPTDAGVLNCTPACAAAFVCEAGACVSRAIALRWLAPGNGAHVDVGPALLSLQLVPYPGRAQDDPTSIDAVLTSPDGGRGTVALNPNDGGYSAVVDLSAGPWSASATWGSLSAAQSFDVGPPALTMRIDLTAADAGPSDATLQLEDPLQPGSHRRDAIVLLRASARSGTAQPGSWSVTLRSGADRVLLSPGACPASFPCSDANCQCFAADLSVPRFDQFRGQMDLEVSARGMDGATVTESTATAPQYIPSIPVTRWGWRRRFFVPMGSSYVRGPFVAVDGQGRAIVAEQQDARATTASITATGAVQWQQALWALAPPLVAQWPDAGEVVHVPQFTTAIATVETAGGTLIAEPALGGRLEPTAIGWAMTLAPARTIDGGTWDVVMGLSYPGDPAVNEPFAYGPGLWTIANFYSSGTLLSVTGDGPRLGWSFSSLFSSNGAVAQAPFNGSTFPAIGLQQLQPLAGARALVPIDGGYVGSAYFAQGPSWFQWEPGASALSWTWPASAAFGASGFVMPSESELIGARYSASSGAMELVRVGVGTLTPSARANLAAQTFGAPALGADGLVYLVDSAGGLSVRQRGTLTQTWATVFPSERFEGSPVLDCARAATGQASGGRPGRLLAAGTTGRLYSIIVDSKGIDSQATWPLALHDPANTNNRQTSLAGFACP